jgi:hypothetical protein
MAGPFLQLTNRTTFAVKLHDGKNGAPGEIAFFLMKQFPASYHLF